MKKNPDEARTWEDRDADPERAVAELREGIRRAREQLRQLRDALEPDQRKEA